MVFLSYIYSIWTYRAIQIPCSPEKMRGIELVRHYAPCPRTVVLFVIENRHDVRVMDLGALKKTNLPCQ